MKKVAIRFHYPDKFFLPASNSLGERLLKKSFTRKERNAWDTYLDNSRAILKQLLVNRGYTEKYIKKDCSYYPFPDSDSLEKIAETIYLLLYSFNFPTELAMVLVQDSDSTEVNLYELMDIYKNPLQKVLNIWLKRVEKIHPLT